MKELVVLGSTGSIGTQTLDCARLNRMKVKALSAGGNIPLLLQQIHEFKPEYVCINSNDDALNQRNLQKLTTELIGTNIKILSGVDGLCTLASLPCDVVVHAIVGMIGLRPALAAIDAGNTLALAGKEVIVAGGHLVMKLAREKNVTILPVDSEHSAIFQCLQGRGENAVKRLILTASGGAFYGWNQEQLKSVTKEQALNHPTWKMGAKITLDCATMMNKGLELIEAMWLFDVPWNAIEIVIHRQSILHSAVEFSDGSIIGQFGVPDMRIPIQYALTYPKRLPTPAKSLSLFEVGTLTFDKPKEEDFPCLVLAKRAAEYGGNAPCVLNAANEVVSDLFRNDKISFTDIPKYVQEALDAFQSPKLPTLEEIEQLEFSIREYLSKDFTK